MFMWKGTFERKLGEKEKATLMLKALEKMSPKHNDIIDMIKKNFLL